MTEIRQGTTTGKDTATTISRNLFAQPTVNAAIYLNKHTTLLDVKQTHNLSDLSKAVSKAGSTVLLGTNSDNKQLT